MKPNEERNKDLVLKRLKNPKEWTWGKLGKVYNIGRQTAKGIYVRDYKKYQKSSIS